MVEFPTDTPWSRHTLKCGLKAPGEPLPEWTTNCVALLLQERWLCTRLAALSAVKTACAACRERKGQRSLSASHNPQLSSPQTPDKEIIQHIFLEREKSRSYINTNAQFVMYLNGISPLEEPSPCSLQLLRQHVMKYHFCKTNKHKAECFPAFIFSL